MPASSVPFNLELVVLVSMEVKQPKPMEMLHDTAFFDHQMIRKFVTARNKQNIHLSIAREVCSQVIKARLCAHF